MSGSELPVSALWFDEIPRERISFILGVRDHRLDEILAKIRRLFGEAQERYQRVRDGHDGLLARVLDHHKPVAGTSRILCDGCDTSYAEGVADWPCSTWELIENA